MPIAHFIEGEAGCAYAREHGCTAVVVDALRASATAAALLHHGARRLLVVHHVEDAFAAQKDWPGALLYGERGGLPPEGFHHGNSPREAHHAARRDVIFTTTNGAARIVQAWGAPAILLGGPANANAVVAHLQREQRDVVLIPAGLVTDPNYDAQEDRAAAAYLATLLGWTIGQGHSECQHWQQRVQAEGLEQLFTTAPHSESLRQLGFEEDIHLCAQVDTYPALPLAVERTSYGVVLKNQ
jgi:2-phosphosulfolactate phosphatase